MTARVLRRKGLATFAVLAVVAEVAGRSFTAHVDRALHVAPLRRTGTTYYPFLLVGVKVVGALPWPRSSLAGCVPGRPPTPASACSTALGHRHDARSPRLRPGLSPRVWLGVVRRHLRALPRALGADSAAAGRWTPLAPWLHTYALPVFAVVSVLVALVWRLRAGCTRSRSYADRTLARVRRILTAALLRLAAVCGRPTTPARAAGSASRSSRALRRFPPDPRRTRVPRGRR